MIMIDDYVIPIENEIACTCILHTTITTKTRAIVTQGTIPAGDADARTMDFRCSVVHITCP